MQLVTGKPGKGTKSLAPCGDGPWQTWRLFAAGLWGDRQRTDLLPCLNPDKTSARESRLVKAGAVVWVANQML